MERPGHREPSVGGRPLNRWSGRVREVGASSPQPFVEDAVQRGRGLLIESQHAAVRQVRIEHNDSVLFGHQQIGESGRAVGLAGSHDDAAAAAKVVLVVLR